MSNRSEHQHQHQDNLLTRILERQEHFNDLLQHPQNGLLVKVDRLERRVPADLPEKLTTINERLPDNLRSRVALLENAHATVKWLGRTTIGAILVACVGGLFALFRSTGH
jgi:hypothetical protein